MINMRRFLLFLLASLSCICLLAGPVSMEKAQQNAIQFLNQTISLKGGVRKAPLSPQNLKLVHKVMTEKGLPAYYVFNEDDGGFVIVSGNDQAVPVLGYTEKGSFDSANLPDGLRVLLRGYERQIAFIYSQKEIRPRKINSNWDEIAPLVKTHWDQDAPFNNLCPIDPSTNRRSITGCVAVAFSQLMYYHKWPEVGAGRSSYQWKNQTLSADFSKVRFQWDKMKLDYKYDTPDENNAVSTLLYNCALACQADFSSDGTAAMFSSEILVKHFRYKDQIAWLSLDKTSVDDFEATIYHELKNERPVFFNASDNNEGHAMVIDGFKEGYFHINLGWRGECDGYYPLTAILTDWYFFDTEQSILYNIQPDYDNHVDNHLYPDSSYELSADGTELIKWKGAETEIDMSADVAFNDVRRIKSHAFSDNSNIVSVILPFQTEVVESASFENCPELETLFIPQSVSKIEPHAFAQCPYLDQFVVSDNSSNFVMKDGMLIDQKEKVVIACAGSLSGSVTIPDGVVGISDYVFAERQLSSVKIPNTLTTFNEGAFMGCQLLSTLTLPVAAEFIGAKAFKGCTGLKQIAVAAAIPPQLEDEAFEGINYESVFLCVPSESLGQYLGAIGWSEFSTVIGMVQPEAKKLVVYLKDGTMDSYMLSEMPVIKNTGQDLAIITGSSLKTYKADNIIKMQYYEEQQEPKPIVDEPYAVYFDGTLTFYCDTKKNSREGTVYKVSTSGAPEWFWDQWIYNRYENLTKVVFDSSFANARPTSTYDWFYDMANLTVIEGLEYLNTSSVVYMSEMFYKCKALTSLDVSHFDISNCKESEYIFAYCSNLSSLTLSSTMENLSEDACAGVGSLYAPCSIFTPDGFNFGVDTSGECFKWKSGYFKLGNASFSVSSDNVKVKIGETEKVKLIAGHGDYSISISQPDVVEAIIDGEEIIITAIGQGVATLTVTDNLTNQQATVEVRVTLPTTIKVEPMTIDFVLPCGSSRKEHFTVFNTGNGTLTFHLQYSDMNGIFNVLQGGEEYVLESGESKTFTLVCTLPEDYEYGGGGMALYIRSDATNADEYDWINVGFWPGEPETEIDMAYAVFKDGILSFYYDKQMYSRVGTAYELNEFDDVPGWYDNHYDVSKVIFDASFTDARPTTTYKWFDEMYSLSTIEGLDYLNTSKVTNMGRMFNKCESLKNIDVSHFDTSKVIDMGLMFSDCRGVTSLDVNNFVTSSVTNMGGMFNGCSTLENIDLRHFDTSNVVNMEAMFVNCSNLSYLDVSHFNTSNVTNMGSMFAACSFTSIDLRNFDTSNVTNMGGMFNCCEELKNIDLSNFNTSNVVDMENMFYKCKGLSSLDLHNFDTSNVTTMEQMFVDCSGLTDLDVSSFNTSKVENMSLMFGQCSGLSKLDIAHFDTSNVTDMGFLFYGCSGLESLDVSHFNTSNVVNMNYMFGYCSKLTTIDVSHFDTSKVTGMHRMFECCYELEALDVRNFDTSNVTSMSAMFYYCESLDELDVSNFNTSNVTDMYKMFCHLKLDRLDVSNFDVSKCEDTECMFQHCSRLNTLNVSPSMENLDETACDDIGWWQPCTINAPEGFDFGVDTSGDSFAWKSGTFKLGNAIIVKSAYTVYKDGTLTFYYDNQRNLREGETFELNKDNVYPDWTDAFAAGPYKVVFDPSFADAQPTTTYRWFFDMLELTAIEGMEYLNTSTVTNMSYMFNNCKSLQSVDVSHFDTSNVTAMLGMFSQCESLTSLDVDNFDISKCEDTRNMIKNCSKLSTLVISPSMENLDETACDNIGWWQPCYIFAPEEFDFGVDTSGVSFVWKSGVFRLGTVGIQKLLDFNQLPPYSHVEIFNTSGKMIKDFNIGEFPQALDLNGVGIGVFLVKINGVTYKIIRK